MFISPEFREGLRATENAAIQRRLKLEAHEKAVADIEKALDGVRSRMGWREKRFFGWFGGDKTLVADRKKLKRALRELKGEKPELEDSAARAEDACVRAAAGYLKQNDQAFADLDGHLNRLGEVKAAVDAFGSRIRRALNAVSSAECTELLDLSTKDKGVSALSYLNNSSAASAISAVKRDLPAFEETLRSYGGFLKESLAGRVAGAHVDDTLDTVCDLFFSDAFGGFDLTSVFTLMQLSDAESKLRDLRRKVDGIRDAVDAAHATVLGKWNSRVAEFRQACRG